MGVSSSTIIGSDPKGSKSAVSDVGANFTTKKTAKARITMTYPAV